MNKTKMKEFSRRLLAVRKEILKVINWKDGVEEKGDVMDEIDQANELIEKEMGYWMSTNMRSNLLQVDEAIERVQKGTYGKCMHCEEEINLKRLELIPFAKYCVPCQEAIEKKGDV